MAMAAKNGKKTRATGGADARRLPRKIYEKELFRLQAELVMLQEWVRAEGARVVVVFEGRDAAGKGSTIKRVTRVSHASWRCPRPPSGNAHNGTSSVTWSTCRRRARSCCSTEAGT